MVLLSDVDGDILLLPVSVRHVKMREHGCLRVRLNLISLLLL